MVIPRHTGQCQGELATSECGKQDNLLTTSWASLVQTSGVRLRGRGVRLGVEFAFFLERMIVLSSSVLLCETIPFAGGSVEAKMFKMTRIIMNNSTAAAGRAHRCGHSISRYG